MAFLPLALSGIARRFMKVLRRASASARSLASYDSEQTSSPVARPLLFSFCRCILLYVRLALWLHRPLALSLSEVHAVITMLTAAELGSQDFPTFCLNS